MIDVHCHLNFHAFEKDIDEVIQRASEKGVTTIINVGTKLDSSQKAVELAQTYENLYAIVGVHPHHADKKDLGFAIQDVSNDKSAGNNFFAGDSSELRTQEKIRSKAKKQENDDWLIELERLARMPKVVGIGEIGLDYFSYKSNGIVDPKLQKELFEAQIQLAKEVQLPIQIHGRHAGKDILEILNHHKNMLLRDNPGMFHCFAGDTDTLKSALQMGFCIGFDGNLTYPGLAPGETVTLSDIARQIPIDRIVIETDSPFLTPVPFRGSRNEPSHAILVGEYLARLKGISFEKMDKKSSENAKRIFKIQ